ncbi:DUF6660 family protein [Roseivirga seohaensis]|uniref:DUF6660 family protein n=1 Tax=Roseivirga seohaensis TaxID=1914963 RepID=UPI0035CF0A5D
MRIISIILSVWILGLSVLPCADNQPAKEHIEVSTSDVGDDQNHNSTEDLCSPLCTCHCCHSHLVVHQSYRLHSQPLSFEDPLAGHACSLSEGFKESFLEPPKV